MGATHDPGIYVVDGMSCEHCVASVTERVQGLSGVERVDVDLATGQVEVHGQAVGDDEVRQAVEDLGYRVRA